MCEATITNSRRERRKKIDNGAAAKNSTAQIKA